MGMIERVKEVRAHMNQERCSRESRACERNPLQRGGPLLLTLAAGKRKKSSGVDERNGRVKRNPRDNWVARMK